MVHMVSSVSSWWSRWTCFQLVRHESQMSHCQMFMSMYFDRRHLLLSYQSWTLSSSSSSSCNRATHRTRILISSLLLLFTSTRSDVHLTDDLSRSSDLIISEQHSCLLVSLHVGSIEKWIYLSVSLWVTRCWCHFDVIRSQENLLWRSNDSEEWDEEGVSTRDHWFEKQEEKRSHFHLIIE